ncbi:MAG: EthD domain-containing protein [Rhizobiaceae bacterium]
MRLKKIAFLVPRPGMDDEAFRAYWRGTHGPVVSGSPGYGEWRLRYVQNHVIGPGPVGGPFAFSGMAEFWLPGSSPNEDTFSQTPIYRDRIRVDEENFIDMDRTVSMAADEHSFRHGAGGVKVVILSGRRAGLSQEEFGRRYERHARRVLTDPGVDGVLSGWSANLVIPGTFRLPGARPADALAVDCVEQLWFASRHAADAAFASKSLNLGPAGDLFGERQSFFAEEIVFFDIDRGGPLRG